MTDETFQEFANRMILLATEVKDMADILAEVVVRLEQIEKVMD